MGICTSKSSVKSRDRDENNDISNQTKNIDSPKIKIPDSKQEQEGQEPERSEGIQETNAPNESINPVAQVLPTSPEINHDQRQDNIKNVERINTSIPSLDPDTAATKIQAVFKGHQVRKNQHNKIKLTDEEHIDYSSPHEPDNNHLAATTVQQDKHLNDIISPLDANEAALKIQAAFKGHQVRKNLKLHELGHADPNNLKANKKIEIIEPPQDIKLSTTIARDITIPQETGDIKLDPESGLELMKEQEAATKIQAAFKGFQVRKNLEKDITSPN